MVRSPDYRTAVWSTYEEMGSWQKIDEQTCDLIGVPKGWVMNERVFARLPGVFAVYGREFDDSDYVVVCMVKAELPCDRTHLDAVINRGALP
jgi:hypothetical protein